MIAIDASSLSRFLDRLPGEDTAAVALAFRDGTAILPPVVVTEVLSRPLNGDDRQVVLSLPLLAITAGHWQRAGDLRLALQGEGLKARLADILIAQSCIDHDVPLITYDRDFRHFSRAGLKLA